MARKFLYLVAILVVLAIAGLVALRLWPGQLAAIALVPEHGFENPAPIPDQAYADPAMWFARPGDPGDSLVRWTPAPAADNRDLPPIPAEPAREDQPAFAVFFIHPTSYLDKSAWNAPLADEAANQLAQTYLKGMASPFGAADAIWAPRYRQATFGSYLTEAPDAQKALDLAYGDVAQAFDAFLAGTPEDQPIVLAGHSQGAQHLIRLLHERVAGSPIAGRLVAAYAVGWPISVAHDLPALGLPACEEPGQSGCVASWMSFAEPAEPGSTLELFSRSHGFDGQPRSMGPILCFNPLTGTRDGLAGIEHNLGTLVPNASLDDGTLTRQAVPARCDESGILLIGDPPELGPHVLPGNNYHVYDIPLFWANLRADIGRRVTAWQAAR